jgi:hypothetical protein
VDVQDSIPWHDGDVARHSVLECEFGAATTNVPNLGKAIKLDRISGDFVVPLTLNLGPRTDSRRTANAIPVHSPVAPINESNVDHS